MLNRSWIGVVVAAFAAAPAAAQSASIAVMDESGAVAAADGNWAADVGLIQAADSTTVDAAPRLAASRLLAGVREYPDAIINALNVVAQDPDLVRRLANEPGLIDKPAELGSALTPTMKSALDALRPVPDVLRNAADHLESLRELRGLYGDAPEGMAERLKQLRVDYLRTAATGGGEWERMLKSDPNVITEYRAMLDAYCRAQQQKDAHFPVVYALKPDYYLACPPDAVILEHVGAGSGSGSLFRMMDDWYMQFGPEARDAAILREDTSAAATALVNRVPAASAVAAQKPETRRAMWTGDKSVAGALGMIPVVLQPLTDQPFEARLAFAVYEHGRLWAGPPVNDPASDVGSGGVVSAPPSQPIQPAPAAQPRVVVAPSAPVIRDVPAVTDEPIITEVPVATETVYVEPVYVEPVVEVRDYIDYDYGYDTIAVGGYYGSCYTSYAYSPWWPAYYGPYPLYGGSYCAPTYYSCYARPSYGFSFGFSYSNYGYRPYCRDTYRSYCGTYRARCSTYGSGRSYHGSGYGSGYGSYYGSSARRFPSGGVEARRHYDSAREQLQRRSPAYGSRTAGDRRTYNSGDFRPRSGDSSARPGLRSGGVDSSLSGRTRNPSGNAFGGNLRRDAGAARPQDARSATRGDAQRNIQRSPRTSGGNDALRDALNRRSVGGGRPAVEGNKAAPRIAPRGLSNGGSNVAPRSRSSDGARVAPRSEARPAMPRITSPRSNSGSNNGLRSVKPGGGGTSNPMRSFRSSPGGGSAPRSFSPNRSSSSGQRSMRSNPAPGGGSRSMQRAPRSSGGGGRSSAAPSRSRGGSRRP